MFCYFFLFFSVHCPPVEIIRKINKTVLIFLPKKRAKLLFYINFHSTNFRFNIYCRGYISNILCVTFVILNFITLLLRSWDTRFWNIIIFAFICIISSLYPSVYIFLFTFIRYCINFFNVINYILWQIICKINIIL